MNATEGFRRIAAGVRWTGFIFGAGLFFLTVLNLFLGVGLGIDEFVLGVGIAAACAAGGALLAWIIEGFAKDKTGD